MKPQNLTIKNNELYLHNYSLKELGKQYGTPLYIYDKIEIHQRLKDFKERFQSEKFSSEIVYATKAFLIPEMLKIVKEENCMVDAVSIGDLYLMKKTQFPLDRVVFHGNNKSNEELKFACLNKVGLIVIDNLDELIRLDAIAKKEKISVNTLFRVNPGISAHTHKYIQTALFVSKFGESIYDEITIEKVIITYKKSKYVNLLGFHSHIGSQIKSYKPFLLNIDKMIEFTKKIEDKYHLSLSYMNLGGGFGIQYFEKDSTFDYEILLTRMIKRLEKKMKEYNYNLKKVFIEPGRCIVGTAGMTLYECGIIKETYGGKNYLFINGGMTDNIRPALYQAIYTCDCVNKVRNPKTIKVDIAGKCCESGDIIAYNVMVPAVRPGDYLVVYATGAYTYSMFSNYNNMTKPAVIFVGKNHEIVSKRETLDDLLNYFK